MIKYCVHLTICREKISDSGREDARNFVIAATKTTKKNSSALIDKGSKKTVYYYKQSEFKRYFSDGSCF